MPFDRYRWSGKFRTYRTVAGVPRDVWMMDTRAGAITDAKRAGASKVLMQHQANHASDKTTNRYIRRSQTASRGSFSCADRQEISRPEQVGNTHFQLASNQFPTAI